MQATSAARGTGVALRHQLRRGSRRASSREAQVGQAGGFALAHRDAAGDLVQVFAKADLQDQRLHLAEPARGQPPGPGIQLTQRLDIGGQPGAAPRGRQ
jgi:hypothetical protein